jgi:hypothetical protein
LELGEPSRKRWFALIINQAIRRGSYDSVRDLKRKINEFVVHYNQHPKPFRWTATTESILAKIERLQSYQWDITLARQVQTEPSVANGK